MKKLFLSFLATCLTILVSAETISYKQAQANATAFASKIKGNSHVTLSDAKLTQFTHPYAFNIQGGGFVIASADDRMRPILAYSAQGFIDAGNMPSNVHGWLTEYENQVRQLGSITKEELQVKTASAKTAFPDSIAPLITSTWSQYRYGYNSKVPFDTTYASDSSMIAFANRPTVGCGALAMAQIMRYWQFPSHGYGQHSYTYNSQDHPCWRYGTVSADFANTEYNYALMPNHLSDTSTEEEINAVATLMFHCGVAVNMNYNSDCHGSSGSTITGALNGLQRYFHYSVQSDYKNLNSTNLSAWIELIKTDLSTGKPIFYCGQSFQDENEGTEAGGHAFVCDGYDTADYFHFNWGWGGSCDGFYSLNVLRPLYQFDFTYYQYAIFGLEPSTNPFPILAMGSDLIIDSVFIPQNIPITGSYSITNLGDSMLNTFVGVNVYGIYDNEYKGCIDGRRVIVAPGDTVECRFVCDHTLPKGIYRAIMQYSTDSFYAGIPEDITLYFEDPDFSNFSYFEIVAPIDLPDTTELSLRQIEQSCPVTVYPNPATNSFILKGVEYGTSIYVYNMLGNLIFSTPYKNQPIDISNLANGIYFISTPSQKIKLIKQ